MKSKTPSKAKGKNAVKPNSPETPTNQETGEPSNLTIKTVNHDEKSDEREDADEDDE